jgi:hypothetical protein
MALPRYTFILNANLHAKGILPNSGVLPEEVIDICDP